MTESLIHDWKYLAMGWTGRFVNLWLRWVNKPGLPPMQMMGGPIQRHRENILLRRPAPYPDKFLTGLTHRVPGRTKTTFKVA